MPNFSDRALAIGSKTDPKNGNDPHRVAEFAANSGLAPEETLPFDESIKTVTQFYQPDPLSPNILDEGRKWKQGYTLNHEWVFRKTDSLETKYAYLREALTKGPVCVSVRAWAKDKDGNYYKNQHNDNHWCQLLRFDGDYPIIGDSYAPFEKKLAKDYDFGFAKVYYLNTKTVDVRSIYQKIIDLLLQVIGIQKKLVEREEPAPPIVPPAPTPTPPVPKPPVPVPAPLTPLIKALIQVESGGNDNAIGDLNLVHKAYGPLQIRQPYMDDALPGRKAQECLNNRPLSIQAFNAYMARYVTEKRLGRPVTNEDMARCHNSGPNGWKKENHWKTDGYWNKVKKFLP